MTKNIFGYNAWFQPIKEEILVCLPNFIIQGSDAFAKSELEFLFEKYGNGKNNTMPINLSIDKTMNFEGYRILGSEESLMIQGACDAGLLYGVYRAYQAISVGINPKTMRIEDAPCVKMRVLNHWDNGDGSIERGYAGKSFFWKDGKIGYDLPRLKDYARLLASVGINQISVNNVNVRKDTAQLLTDKGLDDLALVAEVFRPFHIKLIIAVHFDSPVWLGNLKTSDPVDPAVAQFWKDAADKVFARIPDLAGFLVKADSEFQSGPMAFGHSQDVGANVIAKALKKHDALLYWRCFVYNCLQDWRDTKTDRPKAAYEHFMPVDGKFDDNVLLQIKHGPSDFQVREPNSPLLGAMKHTREGLELQISQEYTGQQIDVYNWAVQWEEIFAHPFNETRSTRDLIGIDKEIEYVVAVSNTGNDDNWCGHLLAQLNLFAFGKMAWNKNSTAAEVTAEWVSLTFGTNKNIYDPIYNMMMASRRVYEQYNAPLGIGWMVCIHHHYGPSVDGYEYMKWGTYHRADHEAIGVDRTRKGTGYTAQYQDAVRDMYENLDTCPEEIMLYFHRLRYDYRLKDGRTLLQYIYDTHFEGAEAVEDFIKTWDGLKALLPEDAYEPVKARLLRQLTNAYEWRDVINSYFYRKTGIADAHGRKIYV